jgi:hypothetical protein
MFQHATVSVDVVASLLVTISAESAGILLQNQGPGVIYIGGPGVTADTTVNAGLKVPVNTTVAIPAAGAARDLWVISSATATLATYLQPT